MKDKSLGQAQCLDLVRPFAHAIAETDAPPVQFTGGVSSVALTHPELEVDYRTKTIRTPSEAFANLRRLRPDGTLRDFDCLVMTTDTDKINGVEELAAQTIGRSALELSFFGLKPYDQLTYQRSHQVVSAAKVALSDRYAVEEQGQITKASRALFPFLVEMPLEAIENWQLEVEGESVPFPVAHPGAVILNYLTRSVSGLRPKDSEKVNQLTANLAERSPYTIDWITSGAGGTQFELARILQTLRSPSEKPQSLIIGDAVEVRPYDLEDLSDHPAMQRFLQRGRPRLLDALIKTEHIKSRILHAVEKQQRIVTFWQGNMEKHAQSIVKND